MWGATALGWDRQRCLGRPPSARVEWSAPWQLVMSRRGRGRSWQKEVESRLRDRKKAEDVFENEKVISCKVDMRSGAQRERNPREWRPEDCLSAESWVSASVKESKGRRYVTGEAPVLDVDGGSRPRLGHPVQRKGDRGGVGFDVATRGERSITVTCLAADYLDLITDEAPKVPTAKEGQPPHERLSGTILVTDGALISVRVSWALSFAGIGCPSSCVQRQRGRSSTKTRGYGTVHDEQTLFERGLLYAYYVYPDSSTASSLLLAAPALPDDLREDAAIREKRYAN
ncbi:hypothetical protein FA13DRAFT_1711841 [Coprinellus micaceus]|uniref:Uncharacterized protein n=1 Tax=Coprinellus micaceus TaxID=71717 RepID=A0A4Y7T318_COPMI|nr:hypothetical protein FA13DRAFT_1711841 [Coprinellus micaceus]